MKRLGGGEITVRVTTHDTYIEISISDGGVGIGIGGHALRQILKEKRTSKSDVGLLNTILRLQRLFGKGLQVYSTPETSTTIALTVPYSKGYFYVETNKLTF